MVTPDSGREGSLGPWRPCDLRAACSPTPGGPSAEKGFCRLGWDPGELWVLVGRAVNESARPRAEVTDAWATQPGPSQEPGQRAGTVGGQGRAAWTPAGRLEELTLRPE